MAIIFIEASSTAAAESIVTEAGTGTLWGVALGTTTAISQEAEKVLVDCTKTRAGKLIEACPDESDVAAYNDAPELFGSADSHCQIWYLRGKMGQ